MFFTKKEPQKAFIQNEYSDIAQNEKNKRIERIQQAKAELE
jgi:hypothetical protein